MIVPVKGNVIKLRFKEFSSNVYIIKIKKEIILIDTGAKSARNELLNNLDLLKISPEEINIIILTHNHFDHQGNIELFRNAKAYGNKKDFTEENIIDIKKLEIPEFQIIETMGHTKGSICIFMKEEKILFSGDTLFNRGVGRTDLPESIPEEMEKSLEKLSKINYEILCPGHD